MVTLKVNSLQVDLGLVAFLFCSMVPVPVEWHGHELYCIWTLALNDWFFSWPLGFREPAVILRRTASTQSLDCYVSLILNARIVQHPSCPLLTSWSRLSQFQLGVSCHHSTKSALVIIDDLHVHKSGVVTSLFLFDAPDHFLLRRAGSSPCFCDPVLFWSLPHFQVAFVVSSAGCFSSWPLTQCWSATGLFPVHSLGVVPVISIFTVMPMLVSAVLFLLLSSRLKYLTARFIFIWR